MRRGRSYVPVDSVYPFQGLNTLDPETLVDPRFSPRMLNVLLDKGLVRKRDGYVLLGEDLGVSDPVMLLTEYETLSGVKHLICCTTKKQYRYDAASSDWVEITKGASTTAVDWTGDTSDSIQSTVILGLDSGGSLAQWIIITNNKDTPRFWNGAGEFEDWSGTHNDYPSFARCQAIGQFYDRIVMANVTGSSTEEKRIAWTAAGELTDFTSSGSGNNLLTGSSGAIVRILPLADRLAIYSEDSISTMSYLGGDNLVFGFETLVKETRLLSPKSIVNIGQAHLFMSQENVYAYDGTRVAVPVGDAIHRTLRDQIYLEGKERAMAFHDFPKGHVYWLIPVSETENEIFLMEYDLSNIRRSKWTRLDFGDNVSTLGNFSRNSSILWNSSAYDGVKWNELSMRWDEGSVRNQFPVKVFGTSTGDVFTIENNRLTDNGSAIEGYWESIDFSFRDTHQSEYSRWLEIEIELRGTNARIEYSTDRGSSWVLADDLELTSGWERYRIPIDALGRLLRVRVSDSTANQTFWIKWLRLWYTPVGAH